MTIEMIPLLPTAHSTPETTTASLPEALDVADGTATDIESSNLSPFRASGGMKLST